ncbi:hypothetical protein AA100600_1118 [Gluconobacter thailandicus F149-1 = NBRC 100600]|nr:hypothetical protein AA100600_1118 [Gluconobacter thailandicus F149-1 = NBRC 100600]
MNLGTSRLLMNASVSLAYKFEMFDGITDPRLMTIATRFLKSSVKKLACWPNKWTPLKIFLITRLLAYKKKTGLL